MAEYSGKSPAEQRTLERDNQADIVTNVCIRYYRWGQWFFVYRGNWQQYPAVVAVLTGSVTWTERVAADDRF